MTDVIKITFELELADNPPLYQDLARFPKGPRRVNRLRTLAFAGLIGQLTVPAAPKTDAREVAQVSCLQEASLELFGPAIEA